jgi:hypothetical protein
MRSGIAGSGKKVGSRTGRENGAHRYEEAGPDFVVIVRVQRYTGSGRSIV